MKFKLQNPKQVWTMVLIICSLIIVIFPILFSQNISSEFSLHMQMQRKNSLCKMVQLAYNSVEPVVERLREGKINRAEARTIISDTLRRMTYEDEFGSNYIFMSTYDGLMLVQPFEPQKEGTNQWELKDANGRFIIQELVKAAIKRPEGSFVTYDYFPPNRTEAEEKLSFVIGIPEIEAYIGTGMYVESTYSRLEAILNKQRFGYISMVIFILLSLCVYAQRLLNSNNRLQNEIKERTYAEKNIRTVFDTIHDAIMIHDEYGDIIQGNKQMEVVYKIPKEEVEYYNIADLSAVPDEAKQKLNKLDNMIKNQGFLLIEWKSRRPLDGIVFDAEIALRKTEWSGKKVFVAVVRDITERKQFLEKLQNQYIEIQDTQEKLQVKHDELTAIYEELAATEEELRTQYIELQRSQNATEELAERYISISEGANDVIWYWDIKKNCICISARLKELLGYSKDKSDITYEELLNIIHAEDKKAYLTNYQAHLLGESEFFQIEFRLQTKDGSYKWFMARGKASQDENGDIIRNAGSITDISERKRYIERIQYLAYYDNLTGLPNRTYIMNELQDKIEKCHSKKKFGAVYFIDIDNFKVINDTYGHSFGDRMLVKIAEKLGTLLEEHLIISRIGGDEFIIIKENFSEEASIESLALKILALFKAPLVIDNTNFHVTCSIGIAVYPKNGQTAEEILKYADLAMYTAKNQGKNNYSFYDNSMGEDLTERAELEKHLREAYNNNEFMLYYQPQADASNGRIIGIEALIRWNSSIYGFVQPDKFIKVAEEMGLINKIGNWVIENCFSFAQNLADKDICVSCNVSSVQLNQSSFVEDAIDMFKRYDLKRGSVALEVTESCLVESFSDISEKLKQLRQHGIDIHLDDFGIGYSSLTYLKNLPIDMVKIDKSFIDDIIYDGVERRIVKTIVSLAHEIGLKVIAEGVETKAQMKYLNECGCNFIQGYLISKPMPEKNILEFIKR